jgi:hypothetical protein
MPWRVAKDMPKLTFEEITQQSRELGLDTKSKPSSRDCWVISSKVSLGMSLATLQGIRPSTWALAYNGQETEEVEDKQ